MDRFLRYWWLGVRLLIHFGIAAMVAQIPLFVGRWFFGEQIDARSSVGIALMVAGGIYALVVLPAVFAAVALPFPSDTPIRAAKHWGRK